jgi:DNA-binding response OmpR family regulator
MGPWHRHHVWVRVLLVEDDSGIASSTVAGLESAGFEVQHVRDGRSGLAAVAAATPDVVLLDLGLPDLDGQDVAREIRRTSDVPIVVVSARSEEFDRVLALELGADDYLVKPFGLRELVARVRAVSRRARAGSGSAPLAEQSTQQELGRLAIDRRTQRVFLDGAEVAMTPKEFGVLAFLAEDPGALRRRTEILEHVWDAHWYGPTKTVDAHVAAIRRKLGDPSWVEAVRGVGFRLGTPQ